MKTEQTDNLALWHRVEKTDPNHTKQANVGGNRITAIAPQYQILNATKEFGSYGATWGFSEIVHDYTLADKFNIVEIRATFFYPKGEFPITSSIKMYRDNALTKVDADFAKKLETDTLTKALSKLGFNADVFMGRYDDVKYMEEVKKEFAPKVELLGVTEQAATQNAANDVSLESMLTMYVMSADQQKKYTQLLNK